MTIQAIDSRGMYSRLGAIYSEVRSPYEKQQHEALPLHCRMAGFISLSARRCDDCPCSLANHLAAFAAHSPDFNHRERCL